MGESRAGLWCKTIGGALLVFLTAPLAALVWVLTIMKDIVFSRKVVVVVIVAAVVFGGFAIWLFGSSGNATDVVTVEIRSGMGFGKLTDTLVRAGIIESPFLFRVAGRLSGIDRSLHVGLYSFEPGESPFHVLSQLATHDQVYRRFTVVEGAVMREMIPAVSEELGIPLDSMTAETRRADDCRNAARRPVAQDGSANR